MLNTCIHSCKNNCMRSGSMLSTLSTTATITRTLSTTNISTKINHTTRTTLNTINTSLQHRVITSQEVTTAATRHQQHMSTLLQNNLYKDKKHPIYNFLFTYVFLNPKILFQYSPGMGTTITGISYEDFNNDNRFPSLMGSDVGIKDDWQLTPPRDHYTSKQIAAFSKTLHMLQKIHTRAPLLNCFGLHEWAMLYHRNSDQQMMAADPKVHPKSRNHEKKKLSKFQQLPLRLELEAVAELVESSTLRCTHFDAFRFFTPAAVPLNTISPPPTRERVSNNDQPGCVHVTMDLFKWTIKIFPFCPSELLFDALELAIAAREIDMRASPYDLNAYQHPNGELGELGPGMRTDPIRVELPEGRKEYQMEQERLYRRSIDIRKRLIVSYGLLLDQYSNGIVAESS